MFQPNFVTFTNTDIIERKPMGGDFNKGNQNDGFYFVMFADGSGGIEKLMKDWVGNKTGRLYKAEVLSAQEYLASRVGEAMNAPIRDCRFTAENAKVVIMPFINGESGEELGIDECYPDTPQGHNLRLFDYLTANSDRRPKNLMHTDDGRIVGIDHALCNFRPRIPSPELIADLWNGGLTLEALLILRPKLENLWGDFAEVAFTTQHQNMIDNLNKMIEAFKVLSDHAVITKGDVVGHEFHGNQYEQFAGGGVSLKASDFPSGHLPTNLSKYPNLWGEKDYDRDDYGFNQERRNELAQMIKGAHATVQMTPAQVSTFLKDGEMKNLFQTNKSMAVGFREGNQQGYAKNRIDGEHYVLGIPKDASPDERPVYGYLSGGNIPTREAVSYSAQGDQTEALNSFGRTPEDEFDASFQASQKEGNTGYSAGDVIANPTNYSIAMLKYIDGNGHPVSESVLCDNKWLSYRLNFTSGASKDPAWRNATIYPCAKQDGSLNSDAISALATNSTSLSSYGTAQVVLKDNILENSTLTVNDSLNYKATQIGVPYQMALNADPNSPLYVSRQEQPLSGQVWDYVETQMFTHPTVSDIAKVNFTGDAPSASILKSLDKAGIPYSTQDCASVPIKTYAVKWQDWLANYKANKVG